MKNLLNSIKDNVVQFRSEERKVGRAERRKAIAELRSLSDSQLKDCLLYTSPSPRDS